MGGGDSTPKLMGIPLWGRGEGFRWGMIAAGDKAVGVAARGRFAVGIVAFGAIAVGLFSSGAIFIGLPRAIGAVAL